MKNTGLIKAVGAVSLLACVACESASESSYDDSNPFVSDTDPSGGGYGPTGNQGISDRNGPALAADISLLSNSPFDGYLADAEDRPLYMFANDVAGSDQSACSDACLEKWPVFDVKDVSVGNGLSAGDFSRFLRTDGTWQTAYKGHPLYYFGMDGDTGEVSGDGAGGRWFVARDYFAFVGAKADLTPQGATETAPFLTNRLGRTSYVFLKDTAGSARSAPVSSCTDACLDAWPIWATPASLDRLILPSSLNSADFAQFDRTVAGKLVKQLSYRGWPLYYHTPDDLPGETSGHLTGGWRAIASSP